MREQITKIGGTLTLNNPKDVDKILKLFGSVKVVNKWNWKDQFNTPDEAIKFLLQQLKISRKITYYTLLTHKKLLLKKENIIN